MSGSKNNIKGKNRVLNSLSEVKIEDPSEIVFKQINNLIIDGQLKPGMKIPSERELSKLFGVGRSQVREALKKLEFHGLVEILPQSGSIIKEYNLEILKNLSEIIISLVRGNYIEVLVFWKMLQVGSIDCIKDKISEGEIRKLSNTNEKFKKNASNINESIEADVNFHLALAELSKNHLILSILNDITHHILSFKRDDISTKQNKNSAIEHAEIISFLKNGKFINAREILISHIDKLK